MIQLYTPSPCPSHWMLRDIGQHFWILSRKTTKNVRLTILLVLFREFADRQNCLDCLSLSESERTLFLHQFLSTLSHTYIFVTGILNVCIFCVEHMLNEWQVIFQMHICCIIYSFDLCSIIMFITQCRLISLVTRIPLV